MLLANMANVLRAAGLTVVEVPGWQNRAFNGRDMTEVRGVLWHHTVGPRSGNMPSLNVLINGRPDVGGPLSQLGLGRDGTVYVVAAGLCNHAGAGALPNIPRDRGNYYMIGIEMESAGTPPYDWTADQIRVAPHLGAALERAYLTHLPEALRIQAGHKEYSSQGKIDPAGWPGDMDGLRNQINAVLNGTGTINPAGGVTEEEMAITAQEIAQAVFAHRFTNRYGSEVTLGEQLGWLDENVNTYYKSLLEAIGAVAAPVVLSEEDVAGIAATLKESLAPAVVAELARRLSE